MTIAWMRNDGLVGHSEAMPNGFGDCSFRQIGSFKGALDAEVFILSLPGVKPNARGFWKVSDASSVTAKTGPSHNARAIGDESC